MRRLVRAKIVIWKAVTKKKKKLNNTKSNTGTNQEPNWQTKTIQKKKKKENDYWEEKGRVHPFLLTPLPVLARIFQTQPKM